MFERALWCVGLFLLSGLFSALYAADGVLTQVSPGVTLQAAGLGSARMPAKPLQRIAAGSTVDLPASTEVVLVCSNDRAVTLKGPTRWQLGTSDCQAGRPLPAGTYRQLLPAPGVALSFHGSLLSEAPSRSDDENGKLPVLICPRSPQRRAVLLADATPEIEWTAVQRALTYDLVLQRGDREHIVDGLRPDCQRQALTAPLLSCRVPWPWTPLGFGEEIGLSVRAHTDDLDHPLRRADVSRLRRLSQGPWKQLEVQLRDIDGMDLSPPSKELLRAKVFQQAELFNEAATSLNRALDAMPQANLAMHLGNLYLGLGQRRAAENLFTKAQGLLRPDEHDIRAAVHLGLGHLYQRRNDAYLAAKEFRSAATYFQRANDPDAAEAARAAAAAAQGQP